MLNHLEVHHVISDGVTNIHHFNLLFGILDIPPELARKVKSSPSRLRVFPSAKEAVNETFFGDRLDQFFSLFESSRQAAYELLKAGRFPFNEDSSMITFFLRVDPLEDSKVACIGGEVDYSLGGVLTNQSKGIERVRWFSRLWNMHLFSYGRETIMVFLFLLISLVLAQGRDIFDQLQDQTRLSGAPPSGDFKQISGAVRHKA